MTLLLYLPQKNQCHNLYLYFSFFYWTHVVSLSHSLNIDELVSLDMFSKIISSLANRYITEKVSSFSSLGIRLVLPYTLDLTSPLSFTFILLASWERSIPSASPTHSSPRPAIFRGGVKSASGSAGGKLGPGEPGQAGSSSSCRTGDIWRTVWEWKGPGGKEELEPVDTRRSPAS